MSEFRKAGQVVDAFEKTVAALTDDVKASGEATPEVRQRYSEALAQRQELDEVAAKMHRKCQARAELEAVKAQLREQVPGAPEDAVKAAEQAIEEDPGQAQAALGLLLARAHELESIATYGAKMVEKVSELLVRFGATRATFDAEITPRLGSVVASAAAEDAVLKAAQERAAVEAAAAEAVRAQEERRSAIDAANAESAQKLRELKEKGLEEERQRCREEEAKRLAAEALLAEEESLQRAEAEGERHLAEVGPAAAGAEALTAMLAAPVGTYRAVLDALHAIVGGIAEEPSDVALRVIRVANEGFQKRLGRQTGVWLFLRSLGFEIRTRESLPSGLPATLNIGGGAATDRFLYLPEPDMLNAYEVWLRWQERLQKAAEALQVFERTAFQRTASLGQHGADVAASSVLSGSEVSQRWLALYT